LPSQTFGWQGDIYLSQDKSVQNPEKRRKTETNQQKRKQKRSTQELKPSIMDTNPNNPIKHARLHG